MSNARMFVPYHIFFAWHPRCKSPTSGKKGRALGCLGQEFRINGDRINGDRINGDRINGLFHLLINEIYKSMKSPTGPTEQTPKPEYLIALSQLTWSGSSWIRSHLIFDGIRLITH